MVWIKFIVCILLIFFSGKNVAKHGDIIAEKSGLGRVWVGTIGIALVTSLPELVTGISAVTIVKVPDLAIGDLLGANAFNLFNLAILDIIHRNGSPLTTASPSHRLTGWFSALLVLTVAISIFVSHHFYPMPLGWIGWYTPVILLLYILAVRSIFAFERRESPSQEKVFIYGEESAARAYLYFSISAIVIIGAGIWLATIGDEIALVTGWEHSFVGSLFLAFTTSLPEVTVSFTAMRLGATDLAIANLIGSNLFNMTIVPVVDLLYLRSPILAAVSARQLITALTVILMTLVFVIGLYLKPRRFFRLSWFNVSLMVLFLLGVYFGFAAA